MPKPGVRVTMVALNWRRSGVEERAATLDRGGPGRHPVGADQEGAAQVRRFFTVGLWWK